MRVAGVPRRSVALAADGWAVEVIDQRKLPFAVEIVRLEDAEAAARAIREMWIRGAPLIGAVAAYGVALAMRRDPSDATLARAIVELAETRPTAVNLQWALERMGAAVRPLARPERAARAYAEASAIAEDDVETCRKIGEHGLALIEAAYAQNGRSRPVRVLTHCNAGWLATVDWGTAISPVYQAARKGIPVFVWVEETRPRNQGLLTAWELGEEGIEHAFIVDNAGGHVLQRGEADLVIVGTDRTTREGDVANKIGTYKTALAARDAGVPFYAAVPHSSIDWSIDDWKKIPIEERALDEIGALPTGTRARNWGFDVTPARLVTGLVTERGVCAATREGLRGLYPEHAT